MHYVAGALFLLNVAFFTYQFAFRPPAPEPGPAPAPTLELVAATPAADG